jgi:hypothetical protein
MRKNLKTLLVASLLAAGLAGRRPSTPTTPTARAVR